ncbi:AAA family ATPase [Segniliparus rugosus]|uniref:AAA family ATPase n=1 Tax=Segniliparus rugosus TaxID=286804 RepID=UPI00146FBD74|nr:AAA family ATPase [Segniliparus rugosus]
MLRSVDKKFEQRGYRKGDSLYRVDEVRSAVARGETIYVVEGENDVHAVELIGGTATCSPMGAGKAKRFDWSPLRGGDVVIVADDDDVGRKHAATVRDILTIEIGVKSVRIVQAKEGKDAADHITAGHGLDDFEPCELPENEERRSARRAKVTWADQIKPEPVVWAWGEGADGRIPAGSLCVAAGREGTGKSSFGIWLASKITTGELEGAWIGRKRKVLYVAAEDSWKHTLVPRLIAAGADLSRVGQFGVVVFDDEETPLSLPVDNDLLERTILAEDVGLIVLDPLMSVISERVDTHRERDVRTALDPLAKIADRTGAVILGIAHYNKSTNTDAASLITGSGAFKNVPRSVLGFARDTENGERVMTQVKNSLGRDDLPSLGYAINPVVIDTGKGEAITCRLELTGESERTVHEILRSGTQPVESSGNAAQDFLKDHLLAPERGGEALVADVLKAGRAAGFNETELKNARARCRKPWIISRKSGFGSGWVWAISDDTAEDITKTSKTSPSENLTSSMSSMTPSAKESEPTNNQPVYCQECKREILHPIAKPRGICHGCKPITHREQTEYYKAMREAAGQTSA